MLVSRDEDRLHAVSEQIRDVHDVRVEILPADLSERERLERVAVRLTDPVDRIDLLINNAGYGLRGGFLDIGVEDHEKQMDTLMKAVLVLSHAAARTMVQRRRGAILNVSSLAGYTTAGPYAASKSWVTVFTESLAMELKGTVLSIPSVKYRTAGEFSRIAPRPLIRAMTSPNWYRRFQQRAVLQSQRKASRRALRAPWQRDDET